MATLEHITIIGFKSLNHLDDFKLRNLNVLIGANGAGKSNLVSFFRLVREVLENRIQSFVLQQGGAGALLYNGPKYTSTIHSKLNFNSCTYGFSLGLDVAGGLFIAEDFSPASGPSANSGEYCSSQVVYKETVGLSDAVAQPLKRHTKIAEALNGIRVYHLRDISETASIKLPGQIGDNRFLRPDASNLAAFLRVLKLTHPARFERIRETIQMVAPFFDDFVLEPLVENAELIRLEWRQKNVDYPFFAHHLSDGTLRFMALTTLLLQPSPPAFIVLDEPELGLHPTAIELLASLLHEASSQTQLLVSTQSPLLINHFEPEDIIVVDRVNGESRFQRLEAEPLHAWLEDYTLGELVEKNVIEAGPRHE